MKYIFLHIPKTGGTSFRNLLSKTKVGKEIYPSQSDLVFNGGKYLSFADFIKLKKFKAKKSKIYFGHYRFSDFESNNFSSEFKFVTILREPVERVISHLYHLKKHKPEFKNLSIHEILHSNINLFTNLQSKYLGYNPKTKNLEETLEILKGLEHVGILENFNHFILEINNSLQVSIAEKSKRYNVQSAVKKDISTSDLELIIKRNRIDMVIYNYAKWNLTSSKK